MLAKMLKHCSSFFAYVKKIKMKNQLPQPELDPLEEIIR